MKGSELILEALKKEEVKTIFGYPGATVIELYEALRKSGIRHVLMRNEQAAAHAANAYARLSGEVGVCIATSGPGATNLLTGIATAYMDSIPIVAITGQVRLPLIGHDVFQEVDMTGAAAPFAKHTYLVKKGEDIGKIVREAFYIARSGRPGPVVIDLPQDVQEREISLPQIPDTIEIRGYKPTVKGHKGQLKKAAALLKKAKRPLILAGGGVLSANAKDELREFSNKTNIPVVCTLMGLSAVENNPLYFGIAGAYGDQAANDALLLADTVLLLGCRVSDRASGAFFTRKDKPSVIHIDIDPAEIGKNEKVDVPIVGDLKDCLSELLSGAESLPTEEFLNLLSSKKEKKILRNSKEGFLDPKEAIALLSKEVPNDAVLISDIGKNLFWSAKNFEIKGNRRFLTAGGLGTMGYSLPAGIGALYACDREIYVTLGDGALQMCLSELSTLRSSGKKLIIILFNNHALGMVKGLQKTAEYENFGVDLSDNIDFCRLAEVYSFGAERASSLLEFKEALKIARESDKTFFIECMIEKNED